MQPVLPLFGGGDARIELNDARARSKVGSGSRDGVRPVAAENVRPRALLAILAVFAVVIFALTLAFGRFALTPVVLLMDSAFPAHVYDAETREAGLTNTHDLTDVLRGLPITTHMELIGPEWKREREVAEEQPALIMIHGSGFVAVKERKDPRDLDEKSRAERGAAYNSGWDKLVVFLGTVSARMM